MGVLIIRGIIAWFARPIRIQWCWLFGGHNWVFTSTGQQILKMKNANMKGYCKTCPKKGTIIKKDGKYY